MTCSRILTVATDITQKLVGALTPKPKEKFSSFMDSTAVAVTAIAAAVDPIFSFQIAASYLFARTLHNTQIERLIHTNYSPAIASSEPARINESINANLLIESREIWQQLFSQNAMERRGISQQEIQAMILNS